MLIAIHVEGLNNLRRKLKITADNLHNVKPYWELVGMSSVKQQKNALTRSNLPMARNGSHYLR